MNYTDYSRANDEMVNSITNDEKDRFENGIEYSIEVLETYTQKRTYVVTARNRQEAGKLAKDMDWEDAYDGWDSDGSDYHNQRYIENQLPELQKSTVKKIRKY